ncbi:MAG TPA: helix-turn-helix transcriptional regulator, partial [Desulfosporosinus sp.]|nr:helix-turn-helix transcriptional regulator [Desulfosporosinus sp.]
MENGGIWIRRINALLEKQNKIQKDLAEGINSSPSTISAWLNEEKPQEPKVIGFNAVANYLGVSMDYLFGADECETPEKEEIHKMTGLSNKAIDQLIQACPGDVVAEKKIAICNYL